MNPTNGHGVTLNVYANQAEAEKAADRERGKRLNLLDELSELNKRLDSKSLHDLIQVHASL